MSVGPDWLDRDALVLRLRSAGCVFAEEEAELLLGQFAGPELELALLDRIAGEPLEHILGWAEFAGLRIAVHPGVFVPRRRSVLLLEQVLAHLPRHGLLVELCCGAGALATAVAGGRADATVHASDIDDDAVSCARENLEPLGGQVHQGDMGAGLPPALTGRVDVVVANAPYVPSGQIGLMPVDAREHEPLRALDGGPDGTRMQDQVVAAATTLLSPTGVVVVEASRAQAEKTAARMLWRGFTPEIVLDEELSGTCVVGRRSTR
jgi:release factor glutamine methyltransferase